MEFYSIFFFFFVLFCLVKDATSDYAPGTQKRVVGEVIRWNKASGAEKIEAEKYIELLEAEIEELKHQVSRRSTNGENQLLEYLKSLEPQNLKVSQSLSIFLYAQAMHLTNTLIYLIFCEELKNLNILFV